MLVSLQIDENFSDVESIYDNKNQEIYKYTNYR